jgi:hypothetical protein
LDAAAYDGLAAEHKVGEVTYYYPVSNDLFDHAVDHATQRPASAFAVPASASGAMPIPARPEH